MKRFTLEKTCPIKLMVYDEDSTRLEIKDYVFTFSLMTDPGGYDDLVKAQIDQNISFTRIMYFIDVVVNESILYSMSAIEQVASTIYGKIGNNLILAPDVNEGVVLALLHMKLNNICQENSIVEKVRLHDTADNIHYELTCDDEDLEDLPSVQDWIGEHSLWSEPWWMRNDAGTWDVDFESAEALEEFKKNLIIPEYMSDFDDIAEKVEMLFTLKDGSATTEKGTVIEIDFENGQPAKKWTPTVI